MPTFDQYRAQYPAGTPDHDILRDMAEANGTTPDALASYFGMDTGRSRGLMGDSWLDVKRGVQNLPGAITGLADIPFALTTGTRPISTAAEWAGEATGFQPGKWADEGQNKYSDARRQAMQEVNQAWQDGTIADIAKAYGTNPRHMLGTILESLPGMIAGGVAGRAAMGIGGVAAKEGAAAVPGVLTRRFGANAGTVAAGIGEGSVAAGQMMGNLDEVDPRTAAIASLFGGAITGAIGAGSARVGRALGLPDVEEALAGGAATRGLLDPRALANYKAKWYQAVPGSMLKEGVIEEAPQSAQEQMWSNWAEDKPILDNVPRQMVEGALAGMGQAGPFALHSHAKAAMGRRGLMDTLRSEGFLGDSAEPVDLLRGIEAKEGAQRFDAYRDRFVSALDQGDEVGPDPSPVADYLRRIREVRETRGYNPVDTARIDAEIAATMSGPEVALQQMLFESNPTPEQWGKVEYPAEAYPEHLTLDQVETRPRPLTAGQLGMEYAAPGQTLDMFAGQQGTTAPAIEQEPPASKAEMETAIQTALMHAQRFSAMAQALAAGRKTKGNQLKARAAAQQAQQFETLAADLEQSYQQFYGQSALVAGTPYTNGTRLDKSGVGVAPQAQEIPGQETLLYKNGKAKRPRNLPKDITTEATVPAPAPGVSARMPLGVTNATQATETQVPAVQEEAQPGAALPIQGVANENLSGENVYPGGAAGEGGSSQGVETQAVQGANPQGGEGQAAQVQVAKRGRKRKLTPEQEAALVADVIDNTAPLTAEEAAAKYGLTKGAVTGILRRSGIKSKADLEQRRLAAADLGERTEAEVIPDGAEDDTTGIQIRASANSSAVEEDARTKRDTKASNKWAAERGVKKGRLAAADTTETEVDRQIAEKRKAEASKERQRVFQAAAEDFNESLTEGDAKFEDLPQATQELYIDALERYLATVNDQLDDGDSPMTARGLNKIIEDIQNETRNPRADQKGAEVPGVAGVQGEVQTGRAGAAEAANPALESAFAQSWNQVANDRGLPLWGDLSESQRVHLLSAGKDVQAQERAMNAVMREVSEAPAMSRQSGVDSPSHKAAVEYLAQQALNGAKNPPRVVVTDNVDELPFAAPADVQGAIYNRVLYLVASNISRTADFGKLVRHEVAHYGLRGFFGKSMDAVLDRVYAINPTIRKYAKEWVNSNKDVIVMQRLTPEQVRFKSIDEAMARMAGEGRSFKGARLLAAKVQDLLRMLGLNKIADMLEAATDAKAVETLHKAEMFANTGATLGSEYNGAIPAFYRDMVPDYNGEMRPVHVTPTRDVAEGILRKEGDARAFLTEDGKVHIAFDPTYLVHENVAKSFGWSKVSQENKFGATQHYVDDEGKHYYPIYLVLKGDNIEYFALTGPKGTHPLPAGAFSGDLISSDKAGFGDAAFSRASAATYEEVEKVVNAPSEFGKSWMATAKSNADEYFNRGLQAAVFSHDLEKIAVDGGLTTAKGFFNLTNQKDAIRNQLETQAERILEDTDSLPDRAVAEKFLRDSTVARKWGFAPAWDADAKVDAEMAARFNRMSEKAQALVKRIFQFGHDTYERMRNELTAEIDAEYDILIADAQTDEERAQLEKDRKSAYATQAKLMPKMDGPYAPLRRFGDYVMVGMSKEFQEAKAANDVDRMNELIADPKRVHYYVSMHQTKGAADQHRAAMANLFHFSDVFIKQRDFSGVTDIPWAGIQRLKTTIGDDKSLKHRSAMQRLVTELYLQSVAETSARKAEIMRKGTVDQAGVAGSDDMFRAFAANAQAMAHYVASLTKNKEIVGQIEAMKTEAKKEGADPGVRHKATRVLDEILARYAQGLNYRPTPYVDKALRLSSVWMLMTSPAYYLQNAMQPFMFSQPYMAGRFGAARSFHALIEAYKQSGKFVMKMGAELDIDGMVAKKVISKDEAAMLHRMWNDGKLDIGINAELGRWRNTADKDPFPVLSKAMRKLDKAMVQVETLNRVTTALAAYRLSKDEKYVADVLDTTHGNYARSNAPRFFHANGITKLVTQFKKYQLIQVSLLVKLAHQAFKGADPIEKAVARAALSWLVGQHLLITGLAGTVPVGLLMAAGAAGGDDDKDWERNARKAIKDDKLADFLLHGVPAGMGLDVSRRLGISNAFSLLPFTDVPKDKSSYEKAIVSLSGAFIGGLGSQMFDALGQMGNGHYYKGVEGLMPRGLRDAMKAYRFATEGVTSRRGDTQLTPDDISLIDAIFQGAGLPTAAVTNFQRQRGDIYELGEHFKTRDQRIGDAFAQARRDGDTTEMAALREEYMEVQKAKREWLAEMARQGFKDKALLKSIQPHPLSTLMKATKNQAKREQQWQRG